MVSWDDAHIAHRIIIWAYAKFRSLASGCKTPLPFFFVCTSYDNGDQKYFG